MKYGLLLALFAGIIFHEAGIIFHQESPVEINCGDCKGGK
jgi:hypothetical protein